MSYHPGMTAASGVYATVTLASLALAIGRPAPALAQPVPAAVELSSSELRAFRAADGTLYQIYVAFPFGYLPDSGARYPVLYLTDASLYFALVAAIMRNREMEDGLPPMILVGVDRPADSVLEDLTLRVLDLSPTRDTSREELLSQQYGEDVRSGGGDVFLSVLTDEIVPWVEERYPVSGDRGLAGHSLGGLFATHVLFSSPGSFTHYLILSPALSWDNEMIFARERAYADAHEDLPARLFLSAGGEEEPELVPNMVRLVEIVEDRQYPGLELAHRVFDDETHMSVIPVGISHGLTFLFGSQ